MDGLKKSLGAQELPAGAASPEDPYRSRTREGWWPMTSCTAQGDSMSTIASTAIHSTTLSCMELRQLRNFLAVIDCGGFSRAAAHLGKSQQALSKSILALEESVGVRLLDRHPKVASPTIFGQMLIPRARQIDAEAMAFRNELAACRRSDRKQVRLGASPAAATLLVIEALLRLATEQPHLYVAVESGVYSTMLPRLLSRELDAFVCIDNGDPVPADLEKIVLMVDEYRVIAAGTHPLAKRTGLTATDLADYCWILGTTLCEIERAWRAAFEHDAIPSPEPLFDTNSIEFSKYALLSSTFLTILPTQIIESELEAGVLCCLDTVGFRWARPIALHYRINAGLNPEAMIIVDYLHKAAEKIRRLVPASNLPPLLLHESHPGLIDSSETEGSGQADLSP